MSRTLLAEVGGDARDMCQLAGRRSRRARVATRYAALGMILLLAVGLLAGCKDQKNKYAPPPPSRVGVSLPITRPVTPMLEVTGTMTSYATVNLVARVEGFLTAINYVDGAYAKAGQLLFAIEPAPYIAQLKQAQAAVLGAQAQLLQAQAEFQRQTTLYRQNVTDQATLDQALAKRDAAKASLDAAQANVQTTAINLSYTQITAPSDGLVTRHLFPKGELVGTAGRTNLATLVQLDPIYVTFSVSDQDLAKFRTNERGRRLTLDELKQIPIAVAISGEDGFPHKGKVDYVSPELDPRTATILVRGKLENEDHALLPGMVVRVRVPLGPPVPNALLVPDRVLGQSQQGRYVLVVGPDDVVEQRTVQLGQLDGNLRVITAGLKSGDRVVTSALDRAIPGHKVIPESVSISAVTHTNGLAAR